MRVRNGQAVGEPLTCPHQVRLDFAKDLLTFAAARTCLGSPDAGPDRCPDARRVGRLAPDHRLARRAALVHATGSPAPERPAPAGRPGGPHMPCTPGPGAGSRPSTGRRRGRRWRRGRGAAGGRPAGARSWRRRRCRRRRSWRCTPRSRPGRSRAIPTIRSRMPGGEPLELGEHERRSRRRRTRAARGRRPRPGARRRPSGWGRRGTAGRPARTAARASARGPTSASASAISLEGAAEVDGAGPAAGLGGPRARRPRRRGRACTPSSRSATGGRRQPGDVGERRWGVVSKSRTRRGGQLGQRASPGRRSRWCRRASAAGSASASVIAREPPSATGQPCRCPATISIVPTAAVSGRSSGPADVGRAAGEERAGRLGAEPAGRARSPAARRAARTGPSTHGCDGQVHDRPERLGGERRRSGRPAARRPRASGRRRRRGRRRSRRSSRVHARPPCRRRAGARASISGQRQTRPWSASGSEEKYGEPTPKGGSPSRRRGARPARVSSSVRVPPPIVSRASSTVTDRPALGERDGGREPVGAGADDDGASRGGPIRAPAQPAATSTTRRRTAPGRSPGCGARARAARSRRAAP